MKSDTAMKMLDHHEAHYILSAFTAANVYCNDLIADIAHSGSACDMPKLKSLGAQFIGNVWLGLLKPIQDDYADLVTAVAPTQLDSARLTAPGDSGHGFLKMANSAMTENAPSILRGEASGFFKQERCMK